MKILFLLLTTISLCSAYCLDTIEGHIVTIIDTNNSAVYVDSSLIDTIVEGGSYSLIEGLYRYDNVATNKIQNNIVALRIMLLKGE